MTTTLLLGDCLNKLKELKENSVDAVVTDPPYGLAFMNKHWDYDVPSIEIWKEVLRVLKPGGHLLSFGGTRTYHRMVVNIEDAGFEIRDQIQWIYGSGFPKSLDVSKAIDKEAGQKGPVVGKNPAHRPNEYTLNQGGGKTPMRPEFKHGPATDSAKEWSGWGTALKPAFEPLVLACKPLTNADVLINLARECQQLLFARIVQTSLASSLSEKTRLSIAQWLAGKSMPTPDALSEVTATLQSESENNSNLSTVLSWLSILDEVCLSANTFTTEMESSLIIDLRILKSLPWKNTQESMLPSEPRGEKSSVSHVTNVLCAVELKLKTIHTVFAHDSAIAKDDHSKSLLADHSANEPIVLARKPLSEKTVAKNVLKWGTGGLNIDGCRVQFESEKDKSRVLTPVDGTKGYKHHGGAMTGTINRMDVGNPQGRFPANLILDEEAGEMLDRQSGTSKSTKPGQSDNRTVEKAGTSLQLGKAGVHNPENSYSDTGGASRFFYCAKASKKERNAGLEGMPEKTWKEQGFRDNDSTHLSPRAGAGRTSANQNHHPTVKPLSLMQYLVRLITPPNGIVLDPFMGSGTTGIAAKEEKFKFIGIERDAEYFKIAEKRI